MENIQESPSTTIEINIRIVSNHHQNQWRNSQKRELVKPRKVEGYFWKFQRKFKGHFWYFGKIDINILE